jgi:hypothetical protein
MNALTILETEFVEPAREWPEISTQTALKPLPVFPLDAMPGILQAMTTEISESVQVQPESAGLALLIIAAAAAGREIFQLYACTCASSKVDYRSRARPSQGNEPLFS